MHLYKADDGIEYPSVTTIIHSISDNKLIKWANVMGFKHKNIDTILEESAAYGTVAHSIVQSIVDPSAERLPPNTLGDKVRLSMLELNFREFIKHHEYKTLFTEKSFASSKMKYGGTLDWLTQFDGELTLIDFKTSKAVHNSMLLQLGGYYNLLKENNYFPKQAGIILISDVKAPYVKKLNEKELELFAECFLKLKDFYLDWQQLNK